MCGCGRTSTDFGNSRRESHRADVIEENERADHVPAREWQHAPDFESAQVAAPLVDDFHAAAFTRLAPLLARNAIRAARRMGSLLQRPIAVIRRSMSQRFQEFRQVANLSPLVSPSEKCEL